MDDKSVVVCFRVRDLPHPHVKDSQTVPCSRCGEAVWLSPTSAQLLERGVAPLCLPCFRETNKDGQVRSTPEQMREVEEALGRPVTGADIAFAAAQVRHREG